MRFTPSLPPLAEVPDAVEIRELRHAGEVRPVRERLFPEHVAQHYPHRDAVAEHVAPLAEEEEKRSEEERRRFCRRIAPAEPLLETRSSVERRRKTRRRGDTATSVDEDV